MANSVFDYMDHPELLDRESLYDIRTMLARYPYSQTLRLLYLKNLYILGEKDFDEELHRSAIYMNERKVLFSIVEGSKYSDEASSKPKEEPAQQDRTESLIDAFLSTKQEDIEKMKLSMEATTDYTSILLKEDEGEQVEMRGQKLIDDFVKQETKVNEEPMKNAPAEAEKKTQMSEAAKVRNTDTDSVQTEYDDDEESYFTETLAKIYVKQGKYSKAIEIIKKLNLKYPKKNVYFADQIRFLEKLIINTKSK